MWLQPLEPDKAKVVRERFRGICIAIIDPIKSTARLELSKSLEVVVAHHVPGVLALFSAPCRNPHVHQTRRDSTDAIKLLWTISSALD